MAILERLRMARARYRGRAVCVALAQLSARILQTMRNSRMLLWRLTTLGHKGRRVVVGKGVQLSPGAELTLGDHVVLGDRSVFEISVAPKAIVSVGRNTWISRDFHLSSCGKIHIGSSVLIGEFVSIRDTTHMFTDPDRAIRAQPDLIGNIEIADNVWIGRGVAIIGKPSGISVGQGAVIGANSVVTQSIPPMEVWAGAPCRMVRKRELRRGGHA